MNLVSKSFESINNKKCLNCGNISAPNHNFCFTCGHSLSGSLSRQEELELENRALKYQVHVLQEERDSWKQKCTDLENKNLPKEVPKEIIVKTPQPIQVET